MSKQYETGTYNWAVQQRFEHNEKRRNDLMAKTGMNWQTLSSMLLMEAKTKSISVDELISQKLEVNHQEHLDFINSFYKMNLK